jgi:hypothetical protein
VSELIFWRLAIDSTPLLLLPHALCNNADIGAMFAVHVTAAAKASLISCSGEGCGGERFPQVLPML